MGLERERYTVFVETVDTDLRELTATITHQDMLRGERALLDDNGTSLKQGLALTTAWCWASLMRQGDYAAAWQQFRDTDCQGIEAAEPVVLDPTPQATQGASP